MFFDGVREGGRGMYGLVDGLVFFEDGAVGARRAVVEDFGLRGRVDVWCEGDGPGGGDLCCARQ